MKKALETFLRFVHFTLEINMRRFLIHAFKKTFRHRLLISIKKAIIF